MSTVESPKPKSYKRHYFYYVMATFILLIVVGVISSPNRGKVNINNAGNKQNVTTSNSNNSSNTATNQSQTSNLATSSQNQSEPNMAPTPSTPNCFTASQAWNEIGQTGCVTFTGYAYTSSRGEMYLNQDSGDYSSGFSVWIPSGYSFGTSILNEYSGVPVNVSGTITQYDGAPEIEVTSATQITSAN